MQIIPLKKEYIAPYLLMQALGKATPHIERFIVDRYQTNKPSRIALLILDLFDYLDIITIIGDITPDGEAWLIDTYKQIILQSPFMEVAKFENYKLDPNHPIVKKLTGFLGKFGFAYKGLDPLVKKWLIFKVDNIWLEIEK